MPKQSTYRRIDESDGSGQGSVTITGIVNAVPATPNAAPSPHALFGPHHTGYLDTTQAPWAVQTSRQIVSGNGLTGGGALSADLTLAVGAGDGISVAADAVAVDNTVVRTTRQVLAGNGLSGGGALSADVTLSLASGSAGAGLTYSSGVLNVGAGLGITVNADDVALTTPGTLTVSSSNSASGSHTHAITTSNNPGAASSILASDSSGYLTLVGLTATTKVRSPLIDTASGNLQLAPNGTIVYLASGKGIQSNSFASGFAGNGWRIDDGISVASQATAEMDNLTVRGLLRVYELLIHKIRTGNGSYLFANGGKVASVTGAGPYTLVFDEDHGLATGDLCMAQKFTGSGTYQSKIRISGVTDTKTVTATLSAGNAPVAGYEYVRLGSDTDSSRRGSVYITADDSNAPYIDVVDGVASFTDWGTSKVKVRMGKLTGITSTAGEYGLIAGTGFTSTDAYIKVSSSGQVMNNITYKMYSGSRLVSKIDSSGVSIEQAGASVIGQGPVSSSYSFFNGSNTVSGVYGYRISGSPSTDYMEFATAGSGSNPVNTESRIYAYAPGTAYTAKVSLLVEGGAVAPSGLTITKDTSDAVTVGGLATYYNLYSATGLSGDRNTGGLTLVDLSALAADTGAQINLGGVYTSGGGVNGAGAFIRAYKVNATDNNYSYGLKFGTRNNGVGAMATAMTIDNAGQVGIGTTGPTDKLQVVNTILRGGTWAEPANPSGGTISSGERIVFYAPSGYKTAIGMYTNNGIWVQAHGSAGQAAFGVWSNGSSTAPEERLRVTMEGTVGIGTTAPGANFHVLATHTNATAITAQSTYTQTVTSNVTVYDIGLATYPTISISSGKTNSGYAMGIDCGVLRSNNSGDPGTLSQLYGQRIQVGHYGSGSRTTTAVYGLLIDPYYTTGTITDFYQVYLSGGSGGGTATNKYGIYQASSAFTNYFAGKVTAYGGLAVTGGTVDLSQSDTYLNARVMRSSSNDGMYFGYDGGGGGLWFYPNTGTSPKMYLNVSGQLGIGTSSQSEILHVVGNVLVSSQIRAGNVSSTYGHEIEAPRVYASSALTADSVFQIKQVTNPGGATGYLRIWWDGTNLRATIPGGTQKTITWT